MSDAISAQGTQIHRAPAATPTAFALVGNLHNITPPPITRNAIETTTHNDPEDSYVVGILRRGDLAFQIGFVPSGATHNVTAGLMYSLKNAHKDGWKVIYPDGTVWQFSGYVTNVGASAPVDDELVADVTIRPTGPMIWPAL
jgi:hypothetical protein